MSCGGTSTCDCGCCAGTGVQTPVLRDNLPGLSAVAYRAGTWASFKESMLARLSSSDYPTLAALRTREDDDFSIALLDAAATMLDVLTFYQERLVNESYLRTAGQLRSLSELSRLIGYQPAPGVSASTYAAFTLRAAPGQPPSLSAASVTIPAGTQMQSVPAQGQTPQTFETFADIQANAEWSSLPVQTSQPWLPPGSPGSSPANSMYLAGANTLLQPGDALLFLGVDRENWTSSGSSSSTGQREAWDIAVLNHVVVDAVRKLTFVSWGATLPHESGAVPVQSRAVKVLALRQKAQLFGHNAPNPNLFVNPTTGAPLFQALITASKAAPTIFLWNNFQIPSANQIDLDAAYPRVVAGSWFALLDSAANSSGTAQRYAQLFRVLSARTTTASGFTLSGRVTELQPDFADPGIPTAPATPAVAPPGTFNLQTAEVLAQSEELTVAPQPLTYPLYGTLLDLRDLRPELAHLQVVALFGKRQKIVVTSGTADLWFVPDDGTASANLHPGDVLTVTTPPPVNADGTFPDWSSPSAPVTLSVGDAHGRTGTVRAALNRFNFIASGAGDPNVSEFAAVASILPLATPYPHTRIQLAAPLSFCYDRSVTTVNVNVVLATNGRSVSEFLGSGQASATNQNFNLKQYPLTYVQARTPTGRQSSLQVMVNGVAWKEVASLSGQGPSQPVFATVSQSDGTAKVQFGDGVEGALLPTGQNNLLARYRTGLGSAGNIAANTLTTLVDRPLGVSGVTNPAPATGGQDPQTAEDIRVNAPLSVLTLGRAVSLADYENFAATFAGIARARAVWLPGGPSQGIFVTVAGAGGASLPPGSMTLSNLAASLANYGNPLIPISVQSFTRTLFGFSADLQYDPAYDQPVVKARVLATVSQAYSFAQRSFGQGVSTDELAAVIQAVPGVIAVNVKEISTAPPPVKAAHVRNAAPDPAEILLLDPAPNAVVLGVMS